MTKNISQNREAKICGLTSLFIPFFLLFFSSSSIAQTNIESQNLQQKNEDNSNNKTQKVVISAEKNIENERRLSTASKLILDREELDKFSDNTLGEILKRVPGITIGGRPGRGGDIRMRGLGSGYTQILINGERAPRGFSIENLSPDQVEKIEVMRGAVAEYSTQAIAGTINIVLREELKQVNSDLRVGVGLETHKIAPNISITVPLENGQFNYLLNLNASHSRIEDSNESLTSEETGNSELKLIQKNREDYKRTNRQIQFSPRISYKYSSQGGVNIQPFFSQTITHSSNIGSLNEFVRANDWPSPRGYYSASSKSNSENSLARLMVQLQHRYSNGSRVQARLSLHKAEQNSDSLRYQYDRGGELLNTINDVSQNNDKTVGTGGKFSIPILEHHLFALGWDYENSQRVQLRLSTNNGIAQFAESGDSLDASTERAALFAQDEFDLSKRWSIYVGVRWESVKTNSERISGPRPSVGNKSSVVSPLFHTVWRLSDEKKDQIRLSVTNTYRAPVLNDLIALPSISNLNSPTRPDRTGNPSLRPELSRGVDFAYEHYLSGVGVLSANIFHRHISDLIRRRVLLQNTVAGNRWISSPINISEATTQGIELEAKFPLQEFWQAAPHIEFRANFSKFWSKVADIPGPNNRLDQQPDKTANLGAEYKSKEMPLTVGFNANWTPRYVIQVSDIQQSIIGVKRQIDLHGVWRLSPDLKLRLGLNNLQAANFDTSNSVSNSVIRSSTVQSTKTYTNLNLRLEVKL